MTAASASGLVDAAAWSWSRGDVARWCLAVLLAAALVAWGGARAWPFIADDAFISLRYAERLGAGHGLTWNDGERVEGYSNLLWTLACAGLGALGFDLVAAARTLGLLCTLATVLLLAARFRRGPGVVAAPAFAAAAPVPVWAIGGLELPLLWLLLTAGLLQCERAFAGETAPRALRRAGVWFAAAGLTRPDAPLFTALAAMALALSLCARGRSWRNTLATPGWLLLWPAAALLAQTLFRLVYYGDYVPNTARVKLGFRLDLFAGGLTYLRWASAALWPLLLPALLAALVLLREQRRAFAALLLGLLLAWAGYLAYLGGDIFPAWRLLSPLLVPAALLAGLGAELLLDRARADRRAFSAPGWAVLLLATAAGQFAAGSDPETQRAASERFEHDYLRVGQTLAVAFGARQPLFAVQAAGALCYASKLPALDMFGLNDRTIATDPAPSDEVERRGALGAAHRRGRPMYLLGRAPDLVNFDETLIPEDAPGLQLVDDPAFARAFRCVWFWCADRRMHGDTSKELIVPIWVRVDGRVGIERSGARVDVPAWLLGSWQHAPGMRYTPPSDPAAAAAWLQQHSQVATWWLQRPVLARLQGSKLVLEARARGQWALAFDLPAGEWTPRCVPVVRGCSVQLEHEGNAARVVLTVDADAALPVQLSRIELGRR